jgi:hypothetical protein
MVKIRKSQCSSLYARVHRVSVQGESGKWRRCWAVLPRAGEGRRVAPQTKEARKDRPHLEIKQVIPSIAPRYRIHARVHRVSVQGESGKWRRCWAVLPRAGEGALAQVVKHKVAESHRKQKKHAKTDPTWRSSKSSPA